MKFAEEPLTWADLILVFPLIVTEVVAACSADATEGDQRLEDIGSRLLDMTRDTADTNPRAAALISALAQQLIATEEGA